MAIKLEELQNSGASGGKASKAYFIVEKDGEQVYRAEISPFTEKHEMIKIKKGNSRNKNKKMLGYIGRGKNQLQFFYYENHPDTNLPFFVATNRYDDHFIIKLDEGEVRQLLSLTGKMARKMGLIGRRKKK